jgi:hypothetical protein
MRQIKENPFVPERGTFIRSMMRRTLKDQLQVVSSKLQAVEQKHHIPSC